MLKEFKEKRKIQNDRIFAEKNLEINRFFALDGAAYKDGAIAPKMKELIGLAASMVLRCDDCIAYHVDRSVEEGASREELNETMNIALIVGGSIVIPHLRRVYAVIDSAFDGKGAK